VFMQKFDANRIADLMPAATVMMGVPTFYTRLLDHQSLNRGLCTDMRIFVSGSTPLLPETHRT